MSRKLAAVAGAVAMVVLTPSVAHAKPRPNTFRFTGGTNVSALNVTCAKGATSGTVSTKLRVKATRKFSTAVTEEFIGNSLGQSTKFIASYPSPGVKGGVGRLTLTRFERFYMVNPSKNFRFPCPMTAVGGTSTFTITIQPYRGSRAIGTAGKVNVTLTRVGASS
jgi:hypothetical protein